MEALEKNEILLEGTEFIGQREGQVCYREKIKPNLKPCVNVIVFPDETTEIQPSFIRGILGYKDDNLLYDFKVNSEKLQARVLEIAKDLECIHGDMPVPEDKTKKKKK